MNTSIMDFNSCPRPWDIRCFQEIALTKNLSRASERLGVGQPSLSLVLKRLENLLRAKLFFRRNRELQLTPEGKKLLQESNHLLSSWERLSHEIRKSETEIVGSYTLGCHSAVAIYALKNVIKDLYESSPNLEIQLVHNLSRIICEMVISGKIDFGIVVNPIQHPDLVIHKLANDEVTFWNISGNPDDVLIYNPELIQSQTLLHQIEKKFHFKRTITYEALEIIAMLAEAKCGTSILPTRTVKAMAPKLVRVKNFPVYIDEITFLYRADIPKSLGARKIIKSFKSLSI